MADHVNQSGAKGAATSTIQPNDNNVNQINFNDSSSSAEDADFGALLKDFEQASASSINIGDVVSGKVIKVSDRGVIIDIGFKSEGIVPKEEFSDADGSITVSSGDVVDVMVKQFENMDGYVELSRADAIRLQVWDVIEKAYTDGQTVKGRVVERIKGGLRVDLGGVSGFLPGSQVDVRPVRNLDALKGREMDLRILKVNKKRSNIVLSRKVVLEEEASKKKDHTLELLDDDVIVTGQVKNITDYGVFVDLGGIDGLLHITDISWGRLQKPSDVFKVGDSIQVKVLKFDRDKGRVSLGYKQLLPDPWDTVYERYHKGDTVRGQVASVTDYGAFIELEEGVEGLVHVSEMSWSKRIKHPSKIVAPGTDVEAVVLEVDQSQRRISLGMKQVLPNPWDSVTERYAIGTKVTGRVRNLTEFGAFVEIEDGIDGLVHVSDMSWTKRIKHPSEALKKGQQVEAVITNIDVNNRRLSLSIKDLEPNAWDRFFQVHKPGDVVVGKITRFASFGAFVELEGGIEGLCHVSELSDQRVDKPESVVNIGQEIQFKILKLDESQKKIGLSARAVGRENDPEDVSNYINNETMTSLGELTNFLGDPEEKES